MDVFEAAESYPRRTIQQDEEEAAQATCHTAAEALPVLWNQALRGSLFPQGIIIDTLVVATHQSGCALLNHMAPQKQILGSILLPEQGMKGNRALPCDPPSTVDRHCIIYALPPPTAAPPGTHPSLLVSCQWLVTPERANALCRALLSEVCPERLVVLGVLPAEEYRGQGDPSQEPLLFAVHTSSAGPAAAGAQAAWPPALPAVLPTGNVVGGLAAAFLQYCQVRSMQSVALLSICGHSSLHAVALPEVVGALLPLLPPGTDGLWQILTALAQAKAELAGGFIGGQTHL